MTTHDRDKVIAAAKEAGCHHATEDDKGMRHWRCTNADMERLYAIAFEAGRQAEREECVGIYKSLFNLYLEAGRQAEREECVGIYKSLFNLYLDRGYQEQQMAFLLAAIDDFIAAIRARSTK